MEPYIKEILFTREEIQNKVEILGKQITQEYQGQKLLLVNVLKGGVIFLSDLVRYISLDDIELDFMAISSYGKVTESTGVVRIVKDLEESIEGKNILIVEDIIDTGLTLGYLVRNLEARQPAGIKICTLLDRSFRRIVELDIDFKGFDIPDIFVVGYGLDYQQRFRNLPYLAVLEIPEK